MRAFVRSRLGDHAGAIGDASRAIELDPQDFRGFYQRGFSLHHQKELTRAIADYDRAIALEPGIAALHGQRGDCLRDMDELGAAVAAYDAAIELSPTWVRAYTGRARALNALTDYTAARRDLQRATELAPKAPDLGPRILAPRPKPGRDQRSSTPRHPKDTPRPSTVRRSFPRSSPAPE